MSTTEQELQRRLNSSRAIGQRGRELQQQRQQEAAELKRTQETAMKEANAAVEAKALAALRSEAQAAWVGSLESFEIAVKGGSLQRLREDRLIESLRNRSRHTID